MNVDYDVQSQQQQQSSHHQQQAELLETVAGGGRCSFLFVQTGTLADKCTGTGFTDCQEPAVWCWPQSCSFTNPDVHLCSINGTSHYCLCSSLPPTLQLEPLDLSTAIPTSTIHTSTFPNSPPVSIEQTVNSTWPTSTYTTYSPTPAMSTWYPNDNPMIDSRPELQSASTSIGGKQAESAAAENDGLPGGAVAAIVVVSFLIAVALIALSIWSVLKLKRKRKLEGKYCPAVEEQKSSANTLPPLPLPAQEGLI